MVGAIYTAIFNDYDYLKSPKKPDRMDHICFTDNHLISGGGWIIKEIPNEPKINRKIKHLPMEYLKKYDYSMWVDGSIQIKGPVMPFISVFLNSDFDMMVARHPDRDCIYDEAKIVKEIKRDHSTIIDEQMEFYRADGYPEHNGLVGNTILIRKHNDIIKQFSDLFWKQLQKFSHWDQLGFNYILSKVNVKVLYFDFNIIRNSKYFQWMTHKRKILYK